MMMMCPSEDNHYLYPEDMDKDKPDDSTKTSDTDRSDAKSERDEFMHHDDNVHTTQR